MRIPTRDVPQADDLQLVVRCAEAVSAGARTFQEIAREIGKYDPRQGRYYRRAAEILGLIRNTPGANRALLTSGGRALVEASPEGRTELMASAILRARVFQRIIPFLESKRTQGITRQQLQRFIGEVTHTTEKMLDRRTSSIVSWLTAAGLVQEKNARLFLQTLPTGIPILHYEADEEPLSPPSYELREYEEVGRRAKQDPQTLKVLINAAAKERASESHRMLTNLVAARIRNAGAIPKRNRFVDLLAKVNDNTYLFEMKSTTERNFHAQVRQGISQLLEYRYVQNLLSPTLVLVTEQNPPRHLQWLADYLVDSVGILLAWDGDGRIAGCPPAARNQLAFLF